MTLFLALLDCVNRGHNLGICPSSVACRPPSVSQFISESIGRIALGRTLSRFWIFEKKKNFQVFTIFFSFSITWDSMGGKNLQHYSSNRFWCFSNMSWFFFLSDPHKKSAYCFEFLKFWVYDFIFFFRKVTIVTYRETKKWTQKTNFIERNGVKFTPQGQAFNVCRVLLTVKCSGSIWGHLVHFQLSTTLYLENGWL